jgi:hypothetical protein
MRPRDWAELVATAGSRVRRIDPTSPENLCLA